MEKFLFESGIFFRRDLESGSIFVDIDSPREWSPENFARAIAEPADPKVSDAFFFGVKFGLYSASEIAKLHD
jgi:hypothetical protein